VRKVQVSLLGNQAHYDHGTEQRHTSNGMRRVITKRPSPTLAQPPRQRDPIPIFCRSIAFHVPIYPFSPCAAPRFCDTLDSMKQMAKTAAARAATKRIRMQMPPEERQAIGRRLLAIGAGKRSAEASHRRGVSHFERAYSKRWPQKCNNLRADGDT
jgi:hypothetical protein